MQTTKVGFGVDEVEVFARLVGVDTRPSHMRSALAVAAERGVPFDEAWAAVASYYASHRDGGAWSDTFRKTKGFWAAAYERDLEAWEKLSRQGRERQAAQWRRLSPRSKERLAA